MNRNKSMFHLSHIPLEQLDLREGFNSSQAGAFCSFEGWVRDHDEEGKKVIGLEYEVFEALCRKEAGEIFKEIKKIFDVLDVKAFHRVGKLKVGEMAVWIGVLAAHRDAAFKACRYLIDEIKNRLPIWKKEHYFNGSSGWIGCSSFLISKKVSV